MHVRFATQIKNKLYRKIGSGSEESLFSLCQEVTSKNNRIGDKFLDSWIEKRGLYMEFLVPLLVIIAFIIIALLFISEIRYVLEEFR